MSLQRMTRVGVAAFCLAAALLGARLSQADPDSKPPADSTPAAAAVDSSRSDLPGAQGKIGKEFREVEKLMLRLAETYAKEEPRKAELLKKAFAASKERRIGGKLDDLVKLLGDGQLFAATKSQTEVQQELIRLLELLQSGEHDKDLADEKQRIKEYIARVNKIIKLEVQNRAQTEGEGGQTELSRNEGKNADRTSDLAKDIERTERKDKPEGGDSKSGDSKSGESDKGKSDTAKSESGDSKSGDSKSGDSKSGDSKSGDSKSGDSKSGKSESGKSESGKSESGDSKSEDSKSGDSKSGDSKSGNSKSGESEKSKSEKSKSESGKSESGKSESGDSKSEDSKSGDSKSGDSKSGDSKSGESESGKSESGKSESGKSESGDSKSGDSKSGDSKSGDSKSGDSKSGKSESGKSESGKSESGKSESGDSESGDSKSGDSKSGDSKSGDSKSGDSKSGDSESGDSESEDSSPQDSPSGSDDVPAKKRLKAAEERMREAKLKLEKANRKGAAEEQKKAIAELEAAKTELEEILRQLREEEVERMLAQLEARFRKMLELQVQVYTGTLRLDKVPESGRDRDHEIEATRLSRKEQQIADDCDKAIALLKEEGSAVAFPEAAEQMHEDMLQTVHRLERANVGEITQGIELDIIKALEEMIAALQKAQREAKSGKSKPGEGGGSPEDQPLVDTLAELKMIRALQMRVNTRTQRYHKLLKDPQQEQADKPDLIEALDRLGDREERIKKIARDIVVGKNQ